MGRPPRKTPRQRAGYLRSRGEGEETRCFLTHLEVSARGEPLDSGRAVSS